MLDLDFNSSPFESDTSLDFQGADQGAENYQTGKHLCPIG